MSYEFKGTPGPWRWELNLKSKNIDLCGGNRPPYDLTVMSFERWGMQGAQPYFFHRAANNLPYQKSAVELAVVWPGREHHKHWFQTIDNPDANLIAAAPDLLNALICLLDYPEEDLQAWSDGNQPITCSFLPQHIKQGKMAIEKALNIKK